MKRGHIRDVNVGTFLVILQFESESIEEETVKQQRLRMIETLIKERDRPRNEIEAAKKREELEEC